MCDGRAPRALLTVTVLSFGETVFLIDGERR
jgi:hypothetical protein